MSGTKTDVVCRQCNTIITIMMTMMITIVIRVVIKVRTTPANLVPRRRLSVFYGISFITLISYVAI